jgi:hypothetical protein
MQSYLDLLEAFQVLFDDQAPIMMVGVRNVRDRGSSTILNGSWKIEIDDFGNAAVRIVAIGPCADDERFAVTHEHHHVGEKVEAMPIDQVAVRVAAGILTDRL